MQKMATVPADSALRAAFRAELYRSLAEALAQPDEWMALPGARWPLTAIVRKMTAYSPAAAKALDELDQIPSEPLLLRRGRYAALFHGPNLSLYESLHREGRLLSRTTCDVERLYRVAGLEIEGAELPDHAALELAFLAFLAQRQVKEPQRAKRWCRLERGFIRRHAGQWLPDVGRALASGGDVVYAAIGRLLVGALAEAANPVRRAVTRSGEALLPILIDKRGCTLCGFCVQVCPTHALAIDESAQQTQLILMSAACTACHKCEPVCTPGVLQLQLGPIVDTWVRLHESPRLACPGCLKPTVSRAEFDFVTDQVGDVPWLAYCPACRAGILEHMR